MLTLSVIGFNCRYINSLTLLNSFYLGENSSAFSFTFLTLSMIILKSKTGYTTRYFSATYNHWNKSEMYI